MNSSDRGVRQWAETVVDFPTTATTWSSSPARARVRRKTRQRVHQPELLVDQRRVVVLPAGLVLLGAAVVVDGEDGARRPRGRRRRGRSRTCRSRCRPRATGPAGAARGPTRCSSRPSSSGMKPFAARACSCRSAGMPGRVAEVGGVGHGPSLGCGTRSSFRGRERGGRMSLGISDEHVELAASLRKWAAVARRPGRARAPPRPTRPPTFDEVVDGGRRDGRGHDRPARGGRWRRRVGARRGGRARGVRVRAGARAAARPRPSRRPCSGSRALAERPGRAERLRRAGACWRDVVWDAPSATHLLLAAGRREAGAWCRGRTRPVELHAPWAST